jgi:hypothetical protein
MRPDIPGAFVDLPGAVVDLRGTDVGLPGAVVLVFEESGPRPPTGGVYERAFARLEGQGPAKEKVDAEVELLKIQAKVCEKDVILKEASAIGAAIANKGAEIANMAAAIANLKSIMETGMLTEEQMAECRNKLFILGMD